MELTNMERLEKEVINVLKEIWYLDYNEKGKYFEADIYVDYNDKLSKDMIMDIIGSSNPYETLNDIIFDAYEELDFDLRSRIISEVGEKMKEKGFEVEDEMDIHETIINNVMINYPTEHFLNNTELYVNIGLDTGDGNYDYTLNGCNEIHEESSMLWLALQQGYSREEYENVILEEEFTISDFLESAYYEVTNSTTDIGKLTFFVKMTLGELIELREVINQKKDFTITLDKNTYGGLVDTWNGAGSVLGLTLEKDIVIPSNILTIEVDGENGYSIENIFGLTGDLWDIKIKNIEIK